MRASDEGPLGERDGDFELVTLRNGARAVRHLGHGEVMHPSVGPWQEARALYVEQSRLEEKLRVEGPPLHVWDVGLGAGTNAIAALTCARELGAGQRRELRVVSFEIDCAPLRLALSDAAGFPFLQPFAAAGEALLKGQRWSEGRSHWQLHLGDAAELWRGVWEPADLIFFDPFSPASNPALWTPAAFAALRAQRRRRLHAVHLQCGHAYARIAAAGRLLRGDGDRHGHEKGDHRGRDRARVAGTTARCALACALGALGGPGTTRPAVEPGDRACGAGAPAILSPQGSAASDARALASLRMVISALILLSPELHQAAALAARPELLDFVPEGAHWLAALHLTPSSAQALRVVALSSGAFALLGYYSRTALSLLTLSALPLYALSQFSGAVLHDMHLFWFSGLLALSPCGDAWSLDSWGRTERRAAREYALPVALCRAFLGVIYFFPGLHKLLESGWEWAAAPNMLAQMHAKWFELSELPGLRIDRYPWLCALGGHAVLLFELGFLPLVSWRKTRTLAALLGIGFHWATQAFLFIPFLSLWACYVVLAPWDWLGQRSRKGTPKPTPKPAAKPGRRAGRATLPAALFGGTVLTLAVVQGVRGQTQAWPIACYPTFAAIIGDSLPDLLIEAESASAQPVRFTGRERGPRTQAEWGRVFRISGAYGSPPDARALREHALDAARRTGIALLPGSTVRVFRADYATQPELWNRAPRNAVLLSSFRLEP